MTTANALPQAGQTLDGKYRIERLLGEGGMGAVFQGVNIATERPVAIKWLKPSLSSREAVKRFLAEARITARIEHPNVIEILDMGQAGGAPYLVMELLRGESLAERIEEGPIPPAEAVEILIAATRGVAEAHREGVIHRDLKPDNIFLCVGKDGSKRQPKVLDFGISKLGDKGKATALTQTGSIVGTPYYMSPAQLQGEKAVPFFDTYALGVVLFEALSGRTPHEGNTLLELVANIVSHAPPSLLSFAPHVPPELAAICERALRSQGGYTAANELLADLEELKNRLTTGPMIAYPADGFAATAHRPLVSSSFQTGDLAKPGFSAFSSSGSTDSLQASSHGTDQTLSQVAPGEAQTNGAQDNKVQASQGSARAKGEQRGLAIFAIFGLIGVLLCALLVVAVIGVSKLLSSAPVSSAPEPQLAPNQGAFADSQGQGGAQGPLPGQNPAQLQGHQGTGHQNLGAQSPDPPMPNNNGQNPSLQNPNSAPGVQNPSAPFQLPVTPAGDPSAAPVPPAAPAPPAVPALPPPEEGSSAMFNFDLRHTGDCGTGHLQGRYGGRWANGGISASVPGITIFNFRSLEAGSNPVHFGSGVGMMTAFRGGDTFMAMVDSSGEIQVNGSPPEVTYSFLSVTLVSGEKRCTFHGEISAR